MQSLSTRLSANGRFQTLLIAVLLITWSLTGVHSAIMSIPAPGPLTGVTTTASAATHHAAMEHSYPTAAFEHGDATPADLIQTHDHCADHCLSVMVPVTSLTATSREVTLPPEIQSAHWEPWRADLTPPPPKSESFSTLA